MNKSTTRTHKYYNVISEFYKDKATSKGIPYINHIDEGVGHLENLHVSDVLINAFILHPFVQCVNLKGTYKDCLLTEKELEKYINIYEIKPEIAYELLLYRKFANSYLCRPETDNYSIIEAYEDIKELQNYQGTIRMLIADKLQNFKDFLLYRKDDHPRSKFLCTYFTFWLNILADMVDSSSIVDYINFELKLIDRPPVEPISNKFRNKI